MSESYVHLNDATILRETDGAFLVEFGGEERWIPKSVIAYANDYMPGNQGTVSVARWFCEKNEIEGDDELPHS